MSDKRAVKEKEKKKELKEEELKELEESSKRRLKELKTDKETFKEGTSPLQMIREKELEISGKVLKAKKKAEKIVADARRKAADIIDKADATAVKEAEKFKVDEIRRSKEEAKKIKESVKKDIDEVQKKAKKNFNEAVEFVRGTVISES